MNFEFSLRLVKFIELALEVLICFLVVGDLFLELKNFGLRLDDLVGSVAHVFVKSNVSEDGLYPVADGSASFVEELETMLDVAILAPV